MSFNANGTGVDMTTLMNAVRVTFVQDYGKSGEDIEPVVLGTAKLDVANAVKGATDTSARLYLCETTTTTGEDGTTTVASDNFLTGDAAVLVQNMTKNAAVQVSAIVWLDGNTITNADVAAVKVESAMAQATLNLQFGTDVELKPASNNALYKGTAQ